MAILDCAKYILLIKMDETYSVTDSIGKVGFFKICILPLLIPLKAQKETTKFRKQMQFVKYAVIIAHHRPHSLIVVNK